MKYDYYNHTNVFKPGYNVQVGVSDGFIRNIYVSSDCSDIQTYIPFMEKYKLMYGKLPLKTPADAGYGPERSRRYRYCSCRRYIHGNLWSEIIEKFRRLQNG